MENKKDISDQERLAILNRINASVPIYRHRDMLTPMLNLSLVYLDNEPIKHVVFVKVFADVNLKLLEQLNNILYKYIDQINERTYIVAKGATNLTYGVREVPPRQDELVNLNILQERHSVNYISHINFGGICFMSNNFYIALMSKLVRRMFNTDRLTLYKNEDIYLPSKIAEQISSWANNDNIEIHELKPSKLHRALIASLSTES